MSSGPTLAMKVYVDTLRGHAEGVPALLDLFKRKKILASIFFSMGPDNSGKAIRRVFKKGFVSKMLRTRAPSTYGLKTLLYGTLLPPPQIAASHPEVLKHAAAEGHDCGVHCWDHVLWQDKLASLSREAIESLFARAFELFERTTGSLPRSTAAPGWQTSAQALAIQDTLGLRYCSDTRGTTPFFPRIAGARFATLQIPTTLPTMDELLGLDGDDFVLDTWRTGLDPSRTNVLTVHAEMEGLSKIGALERFIDATLTQGFRFVTLDELAQGARDGAPICEIENAPLEGRAGTVATQGQ